MAVTVVKPRHSKWTHAAGLARPDNASLCAGILEFLCDSPDAAPFLQPVDMTAHPGYSLVITAPMDIGTVRRKLAGGAMYVALSDFLHDLDLIWDNAVAFNGPASAVGGAALDMRARVKAALSRRRPSFELSSHAQYCMGCGGEASRDKNVLVMCDVCDCSLHQSCGAPQRLRASGSWVCDRCAAAAAAAVAAAAAAATTVESEGWRGDSGKAPAAGKRARTAGAGDVGAGGRGSKAARMDAGAAAADVGAALDASPEADGGGGAGEEEEEDAEASDAEMGEPVAEYTLGDVTFSRLGGFEVAEAPSPQRLRASIQQQRAGEANAAQQQVDVAAQQQARLAARNAQALAAKGRVPCAGACGKARCARCGGCGHDCFCDGRDPSGLRAPWQDERAGRAPQQQQAPGGTKAARRAARAAAAAGGDAGVSHEAAAQLVPVLSSAAAAAAAAAVTEQVAGAGAGAPSRERGGSASSCLRARPWAPAAATAAARTTGAAAAAGPSAGWVAGTGPLPARVAPPAALAAALALQGALRDMCADIAAAAAALSSAGGGGGDGAPAPAGEERRRARAGMCAAVGLAAALSCSVQRAVEGARGAGAPGALSVGGGGPGAAAAAQHMTGEAVWRLALGRAGEGALGDALRCIGDAAGVAVGAGCAAARALDAGALALAAVAVEAYVIEARRGTGGGRAGGGGAGSAREVAAGFLSRALSDMMGAGGGGGAGGVACVLPSAEVLLRALVDAT